MLGKSNSMSACSHAHFIYCSPSTLRRLQSVADPKYEGVKTSRKQLMEDSDHEPSDLENDYPDEESEPDDQSGDEEDDNQSIPSQSEPEEASDEPHATSPPPKKSNLEPEPAEDLSSTLRKTREEDRKKGKAVSQQIVRI